MIDGKNEQPLISIIMPTFNQASFIGEAIDSVLNQTYRNYELIIINNYSNDNTERIVKSYTDKRIKYYKFRNHGIIAAARNFGIRQASGEYIAFLDSDDIWRQKKLEKQLDIMKTNREIGLSYVLYAHLFKNGTIKGEYPAPHLRCRGNIFQQLYMINTIPNSGAMVRTAVLEKIGLLDENPKLVGVEDADMWLRISREYRVEFIPDDILFLYRVGGNNRYYKKIMEKILRRLYIAGKYYPEVGLLCFLKKIAWSPLYCLLRQWISTQDA